MKLTKKYIKNHSLKLPLRLENKLQRTSKIIKSEFEHNKVEIQIAKELFIKKVQDVFDEIKEEELINPENFLIDHNDILDSEEISHADREIITDLINRTDFIASAKRFVEEANAPKMEMVHHEKKS